MRKSRRTENSERSEVMETQRAESKMKKKHRILKLIRMNENKLSTLIGNQNTPISELQVITSELGEQASELLDVVEEIWEETNGGEVESGPLWEMFHSIEANIQAAVNVANRYIRKRLTESIGDEAASANNGAVGEQNEIEKVLKEGKNRKHVETPVKFVTQSSRESSRLSYQSLTDQKDIVTGLRSSTPSLEKQMFRQNSRWCI